MKETRRENDPPAPLGPLDGEKLRPRAARRGGLLPSPRSPSARRDHLSSTVPSSSPSVSVCRSCVGSPRTASSPLRRIHVETAVRCGTPVIEYVGRGPPRRVRGWFSVECWCCPRGDSSGRPRPSSRSSTVTASRRSPPTCRWTSWRRGCPIRRSCWRRSSTSESRWWGCFSKKLLPVEIESVTPKFLF
jgi:hypothetical protein